MKKTKALLSIVLVLLMLSGIFSLSVAALSEGDYEFRILDDNTAEITGYTGSSNYVFLSSSINSYENTVTRIGDSALKDKTFKRFFLPDTILEIGAKAFSGCSELTEVGMYEGVKKIGDNAFENCSSLTSIIIPQSVKDFGKDVFKGCTSLQVIEGYSVAVKNYAESIGVVFHNLTPASEKTEIALKDTKKTVYIFSNYTIGETVANPSGETTYSSDNEKIARVDKKGVVTALGLGTTKIHVKNSTAEEELTLTVKSPFASEKNKTITLCEGENYTFKYKGIQPSSVLSFTSSKKAAVSVTSKGKLTAKKAGKAVITAKVSAYGLVCKKSLTVKVIKPKLKVATVTLVVGESYKLTLVGKCKKLSFKSSNSKVASVNKKSGLVKAKKVGSATITAIADKRKLKCNVKVVKPNLKITIPTQPQSPSDTPKSSLPSDGGTIDNPKEKIPPTIINNTKPTGKTKTLTKGKTYSVTLYNSYYLNYSVSGVLGKVSWSSSDSKVALVSDGVIVGVKSGTAVVTAKYKTQTVKFKVKVPKNYKENTDLLDFGAYNGVLRYAQYQEGDKILLGYLTLNIDSYKAQLIKLGYPIEGDKDYKGDPLPRFNTIDGFAPAVSLIAFEKATPQATLMMFYVK